MERKRKAVFCVNAVQNLLKKRKKREDEDFDELLESVENYGEKSYDENNSYVASILSNATAAVINNRKRKRPRKPDIDRSYQKQFWDNGYANWDDEQFKSGLRINCETFEFILAAIHPHILKKATNFRPNPIEPHRQLALTLYRLLSLTHLSTWLR